MSWSVQDLRKALADYENLLTFEEVGDIIKVQVKEFLRGERGKAKWEAINEQIKQFGGTWVGGIGANSHWKVKRETPQVGKAGRVYSLTEKGKRYGEAIQKIRAILEELEKGE